MTVSGKHFLGILLLAALVIAMPYSAFSTVPQKITYQGYLTGTDGLPINRSVVMQLGLYEAATGGTPLWTEQQVVQVTKGIYTVNLGEVAPLNLTFDKSYYLGIKIDTDQEMTPRHTFTSSPYALRSDFSTVADSVADGSIKTSSLADNAITASKIGILCATGQALVLTSSGWGCGNLATAVTNTYTGTITGITAGAGLTGGGVIGNINLDVNFNGTGTALTSARSDHNHDAVYQKRPGNIAIVAKTNGDYATPVAALADSAVWCGVPSAANPCLVKIMPGVYDLGNASLIMQNYIDMMVS